MQLKHINLLQEKKECQKVYVKLIVGGDKLVRVFTMCKFEKIFII
jgi:hypothetical protein